MLPDWNEALTGLLHLLASIYPDREKARLLVRRAGLDPDEIDIGGVPKVFWMRIVEEANRRGKVPALIGAAKSDFDNIDFTPLEGQLRQPGKTVVEPDIPDGNWKGRPLDGPDLERVMGAQPTFQPINFLELGLLRARAVGRVAAPRGIGTGFLIQGNLFITNHHVLPNAADAQDSSVWFNYQTSLAGMDGPVTEVALDPDTGFATSPLDGGDDWTAVRVAGPVEEWGHLELAEASVKPDDYVNIIQHPSGMPKQIALYHNVVTYADDSRVQYLTDTMPGSSGSPVFDTKWRVVAVHHSGGWLSEPGKRTVRFRNEGIHVRAVIKGLRAHGLL